MSELLFNSYQEAAIKTRKNTIVAAGAGSGKTSVLSERFSRLLEDDGLPLESILCLTFTRKAAAEMYARIHNRLFSSKSPAAARALSSFDEARILTLDSFCSTLARNASRHYGISPNFTTDEARLSRLIDRQAIATMMAHRDLPVLRRLIAHLGFDTVRRDLFGLLALNAIPIIRATSFSNLATLQIQVLENKFSNLLDTIHSHASSFHDLDSRQHKKYADLQEFFSSNEIPDSLPARKEYSLYQERFSLWGKDTVFRRGGKHGLDDELASCKAALTDCGHILASLLEEDHIRALGPLLDEFAQLIDSAKRAEGILSFNDVGLLARQVLIDHQDIRAWYKERILAIMIDEFQDNNAIQKDLLFLLAERNDLQEPGIPSAKALNHAKLFFVGDEKQSIYRFRGADVSVFRSLSSELNDDNHDSCTLPLCINYRSSPELINFFNAIFPGIFGAATAPWEARFQALSSPPGIQANPAGVAVEIHISCTDDVSIEDDSSTQTVDSALNEAFETAQIIRSAIDDGRFKAGDFAILFRSTGQQGHFERMLSRFDIPWTTPEPRGVFLEALANDFCAFLRLLLWPSDRLSYATILRSPFVQLNDQSVFAILASEDTAPFTDAYKPAWFTSRDEESRWLQGVSLFSKLKERARVTGSAGLLSFLWYESPYRHNTLCHPEKTPLAVHFDLLLELAVTADSTGKPLSAFVDDLASSMGSTEKLKSGREGSGGLDAVTILTIHKSKGLEFPAVILPLCGSEGKNHSNDKPWYHHKELGPVINLPASDDAKGSKTTNWLFNEAKEEEQAMALAELCRLFYVAATRAEKALYLIGELSLTKEQRELLDSSLRDEARILDLLKASKKERKKIRSFISLLAEGLNGDSLPHTRFITMSDRTWVDIRKGNTCDASKTVESFPIRSKRLARYHEGPLLPKAISRTLRCVPSRLGHDDIPENSSVPLLSNTAIDGLLKNPSNAALFGTLCHRYLELLILKRPELCAQEANRILTASNLSPELHPILVQIAQTQAELFLKSEWGEKALSSPKRKTEYPFLLPLNTPDNKTVLFNGSMDLVFESGGNCIIIDFKTDSHFDPDRHRIQLALYALAAPAFSRLPVQTLLVYLRSGQVVPVNHEDITRDLIIRMALQEQEEHA